MSYNRFNQPRAYVDLISYDLATGWRTLSNITLEQDDGSAVTFVSGSDEKAKIFDARPTNYGFIEKENQSFFIQYDTGNTSNELAESNFVAIMNHNLAAADAVFTIQIDDDANMSSPTSISTTGNHTKVFNADANDTAGEIDPAKDGWTLITWPTKETDNRFIRLTFSDENGTGQNFAQDVVLGNIMLGEYFDFPSMDLSLGTDIEYDGTTIQRSLGGNMYANTTHLGNPVWQSTLPWHIATGMDQDTKVFKQRFGRMRHSLSFSHIVDTDIWPEDMASGVGSDNSKFYDTTNLHNSFYQKILGQRNPFLFSINKDSTDTGDYGLFRVDSDTFSSSHTIHKVWSTKMDLREHR